MTQINYTDYVTNLIALEDPDLSHRNVGASAPPTNAGDNTGPYDPNNTDFDISIPRNPDGSINVQALLEKLRQMLYYGQNGDPLDYNVLIRLGEYMANIGNVWGQLPPDAQQQISATMGPMLGSGNSDLGELLAEAIIQGEFYFTKGNAQETEAFAKNFLNMLGPISQTFPWMQDFYQQVAAQVQNLPQFMQQHTGPDGKPDMDFDAFSFIEGLKFEAIVLTTQMSQWFDNYHHLEIEQFQKEISDPFVLFVMILMVLFGENDDMGTQVGGSGKLLDRLSQLGQQVNTMMNQFQAGSFTGTSAKTFFDEMSSFANLFRDQRLASAFPQVMMVYNNFFSTNTSTGNPIVTTVAETIGGTTYPVGTPIGAIYAACQKEAAANPNDKNPYAALADAMNNFYPNPSNPTSVTPGYQTINQDISQLNSSVTSVSNLTTQQAQTVTSLIEKLQAMLSASLSEITDVNKFIVQAIQSSKG